MNALLEELEAAPEGGRLDARLAAAREVSVLCRACHGTGAGRGPGGELHEGLPACASCNGEGEPPPEPFAASVELRVYCDGALP